MTEFGSTQGIIPEAAYQSSFGRLPNNTTYLHYPPKAAERIASGEAKSFDLARDLSAGKSTGEVKALETDSQIYATGTSYTATSGSLPTLLPIWVDKELSDETQTDFPFMGGLFRRVSNRSVYADWNRRTALSTSAFRAQDGALPDADATYTRNTSPIRFAYAVGRITGPMLVASKEWQDALRLEVEEKRRSLVKLLESQMVNGSASSTAFAGLASLITTNTTAAGGATITLQNLRDDIRTCRLANGHPDLIMTDYKTLDDIKALIQNELRYPAPTANIAWGIQSISFEGLQIVPSLSYPSTASGKELHVLDTKVIEIRVLQDMTFEELAKTNDSFKFMIKFYGTLIVKSESFCFRHSGLL